MTRTTSAARNAKADERPADRWGEAELAKSEKAAPSLVQWVMRRTRGMTGMAPPIGMCASTQVLVSRSSQR